jgi:hypothetical protein
LDFPVVTQFLKQNGMSLDWFIDSLNDASLAGTANGARESKVAAWLAASVQQCDLSYSLHQFAEENWLLVLLKRHRLSLL